MSLLSHFRFSASDIWRRSQLILALCPKDIRWREKWVGCLLESLEQAPEDKQTSPFEELNRTGGVCLCAFVSSVLHLHQNSTCPIESTVPEVSSQQQRTCCAKSCVRFAIRTSMSVMSAARICVPSRLSSEDPYAALLEDCVLAPLSPPMWQPHASERALCVHIYISTYTYIHTHIYVWVCVCASRVLCTAVERAFRRCQGPWSAHRCKTGATFLADRCCRQKEFTF